MEIETEVYFQKALLFLLNILRGVEKTQDRTIRSHQIRSDHRPDHGSDHVQNIRFSIHDPIRDPVCNPVRDLVHDPVRDPVRDPVYDLVREPVRDPIRPGADFVEAVFRVTPRANSYT